MSFGMNMCICVLSGTCKYGMNNRIKHLQEGVKFPGSHSFGSFCAYGLGQVA